MLLVALFGEPVDAASSERLTAVFAPNLRCPEPATLLDALELRLAPLHVDSNASVPARYRLEVAPNGARAISLELREGEALLAARTLEVAPAECAVVADTLALITATWIQAPRAPEAPSTPPPSDALDTGEAPQVDSPDTLQPSAEPAQVQDSATEPKSDTPSAAPRDSSQPSAAGREMPDGARRPDTHLALEVAGGTVLPVQGHAPVAIARIGVEAARGPWLLGLRGHVETADTVGEGGGVSVRHTSAELSVGAVPVRSTGGDFALLLGGGVDVVTVNVTGYANTDIGPAFAPIASLAVRGTWRVSPGLAFLAAAELVVAFRREHFLSQGEPIALTPRARSYVVLGASWNLF